MTKSHEISASLICFSRKTERIATVCRCSEGSRLEIHGVTDVDMFHLIRYHCHLIEMRISTGVKIYSVKKIALTRVSLVGETLFPYLKSLKFKPTALALL